MARKNIDYVPLCGALDGDIPHYLIKATVRGVSAPPIWRRIVVPCTCNCLQLGAALLDCMDWEDCDSWQICSSKRSVKVTEELRQSVRKDLEQRGVIASHRPYSVFFGEEPDYESLPHRFKVINAELNKYRFGACPPGERISHIIEDVVPSKLSMQIIYEDDYTCSFALDIEQVLMLDRVKYYLIEGKGEAPSTSPRVNRGTEERWYEDGDYEGEIILDSECTVFDDEPRDLSHGGIDFKREVERLQRRRDGISGPEDWPDFD